MKLNNWILQRMIHKWQNLNVYNNCPEHKPNMIDLYILSNMAASIGFFWFVSMFEQRRIYVPGLKFRRCNHHFRIPVIRNEKNRTLCSTDKHKHIAHLEKIYGVTVQTIERTECSHIFSSVHSLYNDISSRLKCFF